MRKRILWELLSNPRWTKSHVKVKPFFGASTCRKVTETTPGTIKRDMIGMKDIPTCMECRYLVSFMEALRVDNQALSLMMMKYIQYAHIQEHYHGARL